MNNLEFKIKHSMDIQAVSQLVINERHYRDRGWCEKWKDCFADDSLVEISWFKGTGAEFVEQTRLHSVQGRHRLSPPSVQVNGDRAYVELPLAIEFRNIIGDVEADLVSYTRSQYRAIRLGGIWRIVKLTAIYERDTLTPTIPGTTLILDTESLKKYRPSYRFISYNIKNLGIEPKNDLLGEDKPEAITAFYEKEMAWLKGEQ
ncbi:SnoaL-like domain-containing protein [Flavobacterium jejuense]|uniref:SnoaL-like domain-containing protein n=1 Tax=Flavobacterium jejuense TaxID=1544455 RepID=A0ABX0ITU8_9FLAO|nr:nuclear transport factor 2 family protein [Flavobacterium jejuense]NHN27307.1 SnoaL-like domain-containing protein [Flavobacterium jejuense]